MQLGFGLNFGSGEPLGGTLVDAPDPYLGYTGLNTTDIAVTLQMLEDIDSQIAPAGVSAWADITTTGSRVLGGLPIRPYMQCHVQWTLTKADDSPVDYDNEIYSYVEEAVINPATDSIKPEFSDVLWHDGDYKLHVAVYGYSQTASVAAGSPKAWMAEDEIEFTLAKNTQERIFFDDTNGNDANNGLDPHAIALTNGSYTESTGELTQTGVFAGLTLDGRLYDQNTGDWIYIDGHGPCRIASKTNDNTVVLHDRYKLGSDLTGLTSSSTGPKQTPTNALATDDRVLMLKVNDDYDIAATISWVNKSASGVVGISGYGGSAGDVATILSSTLGASSDLIWSDRFNSSAVFPSKVYLDGIKLDCQDTQQRADRAAPNEGASDEFVTKIYGNYQIANQAGGVFSPGGFSNDPRFIYMKGFKNLVDRVTYPSLEVDQLYWAFDSNQYLRICGADMSVSLDSYSILDHYLYPDFKGDHIDLSWINFIDGDNPSYAINFNVYKGSPQGNPYNIRYAVIHGCYAVDSVYFLDVATDLNSERSGTHWIHDMVVTNNQCVGAVGSAVTPTLAKSIFIGYNEFANTATTETYVYQFTSGKGVSDIGDYGLVPADYEMAIEGNKTFGGLFFSEGAGVNYEVINNRHYAEGASRIAVDVVDDTDQGSQTAYMDGNIFNLPDNSGEDWYEIGGVASNLSELNAHVHGTNTEEDFSFVDPLNGDFDVSTGLELTFNRANSAYATITGVNMSSSDTISFVFRCGTAGFSRTLLDGTGSGPTAIGVDIDFASRLQLSGAISVTIDSVSIADGADITSYLDNTDHTLEITCTGSSPQVSYVGFNGTSQHYDGVIKQLDLDIGGVRTLYNIDSGSTTTEAASIGSGTMTFTNVVAGDWS